MEVTESSVNYILNELTTWLDANPIWQINEGMRSIEVKVHNSEDLNLRFCAYWPVSPIGIPRFAYLFNNTRIRGFDHENRYRDIEGVDQSGWHEHKWSDSLGEDAKFPNEDFEHIPNERKLDYVLKRWKIEYPEQLRFFNDEM